MKEPKHERAAPTDEEMREADEFIQAKLEKLTPEELERLILVAKTRGGTRPLP